MKWPWSKPEPARVSTKGYEVRLGSGKASNLQLIERAKGRIERLEVKRAKQVLRGDDTSETDEAILRYKRQIAWSDGEVNGHTGGVE